MKKSGLHKQISSIFDGGPQESTEQASAPAGSTGGSAASVMKRLYGGFEEDSMAATTSTGSSSAHAETLPASASPGEAEAGTNPSTQAQAATDAEHRTGEPSPQEPIKPAVPEGRPVPLPKVKIAAKPRPQRANWSKLVQERLFGQAGADPHQKKMALLAGGLAVVFGVVLFFSFGGGIGAGGTSSYAKETQTDGAVRSVSSGPVWEMPEVLPDRFRDPMNPLVVSDEAGVSDPASREFVVKGIVFSQKHSSALINDEIIREGETFDGIKVVRISKTDVEFEADGRRWTQPVRP